MGNSGPSPWENVARFLPRDDKCLLICAEHNGTSLVEKVEISPRVLPGMWTWIHSNVPKQTEYNSKRVVNSLLPRNVDLSGDTLPIQANVMPLAHFHSARQTMKIQADIVGEWIFMALPRNSHEHCPSGLGCEEKAKEINIVLNRPFDRISPFTTSAELKSFRRPSRLE